MTTATNDTAARNGRPARPTLSGQIDRLDGVLDGLAEALDQSVADAVRDAVGRTLRQSVEAAVRDVLGDPEPVRAAPARHSPAAALAPDAGPAPRRPLAQALGRTLGCLCALAAGKATGSAWAWALANLRAAAGRRAGVAARADVRGGAGRRRAGLLRRPGRGFHAVRPGRRGRQPRRLADRRPVPPARRPLSRLGSLKPLAPKICRPVTPSREGSARRGRPARGCRPGSEAAPEPAGRASPSASPSHPAQSRKISHFPWDDPDSDSALLHSHPEV